MFFDDFDLVEDNSFDANGESHMDGYSDDMMSFVESKSEDSSGTNQPLDLDFGGNQATSYLLNVHLDPPSNTMFDLFGYKTQDIENKLEFEPEGGYHPSFGASGYSQSEINSHITQAKHDIAEAESNIRHNTSIANSKARIGEPHSLEDSHIRSAQSRLNDAKSELYKWQHTKPSK